MEEKFSENNPLLNNDRKNNNDNELSKSLIDVSSDEQEIMLAKKYIKGKFDDNNTIISSLLKNNKHGKHDKKINRLIHDNEKLKVFFKFHKKFYRIQRKDKENRKTTFEQQTANKTYSICNCLRKCCNLFNCCSKTKNPSKQN